MNIIYDKHGKPIGITSDFCMSSFRRPPYYTGTEEQRKKLGDYIKKVSQEELEKAPT